MSHDRRCGVKCAHKDDVHDCERCSKCVAFICAPLCTKCPNEGRDTCICPVSEFAPGDEVRICRSQDPYEGKCGKVVASLMTEHGDFVHLVRTHIEDVMYEEAHLEPKVVSGHRRAQRVLDGMSDAQVCATLRALEERFPLDPAETCNGVGIGEWHELVYAEWDRRGGTWKVWEGNKRKTVTVSYTVPDHAEHLELSEHVLRMLFADALHEFSRRGTPRRRDAHEYVATRYANVFKRPEEIERKVAEVTLRCDIAEALVLESVKVD